MSDRLCLGSSTSSGVLGLLKQGFAGCFGRFEFDARGGLAFDYDLVGVEPFEIGVEIDWFRRHSVEGWWVGQDGKAGSNAGDVLIVWIFSGC